MNKKIYVGGLAYSVTGEQLKELFQAHGTVESATVVTDKYTGQSRGFGFVEMGTQAEAEKAISALNGTQFQGRSPGSEHQQAEKTRLHAAAAAVKAAASGTAGNSGRIVESALRRFLPENRGHAHFTKP